MLSTPPAERCSKHRIPGFGRRVAIACLAAILGAGRSEAAEGPGDAATRPGRDPGRQPKEEAEIRKQRALWKAAFEAGDVERLMSFYAPGAATVAFDVLPPLQYPGFDAYRQHWSAFLALFQGLPKVDVTETQIVCSGDVAFVHALVGLKATLRDGRPLDIWMRATNGLRKIGGKWLVVHDHVSLPVDITTGVPSMNLTP